MRFYLNCFVFGRLQCDYEQAIEQRVCEKGTGAVAQAPAAPQLQVAGVSISLERSSIII